MKLETKRLILRLPTKKDIKDIIEGINDLEITKWLLVVPYPYKKKDALWYVKHSQEKAKKKEGYNFNIELKEEKKIIGGISVSKIDKFQGTATIGYWIAKRYWRKGYASEAFRALLDFAFNKLGLRRLELAAFLGNEKSKGLAEKMGFKVEGIKKQAVKCKATGKIHDEWILALLKEDYKSS